MLLVSGHVQFSKLVESLVLVDPSPEHFPSVDVDVDVVVEVSKDAGVYDSSDEEGDG